MKNNRKILHDAGMHPGKIREVESWIRSNRKVVISKEHDNGIADIFTIEAEIGSLEVLEI